MSFRNNANGQEYRKNKKINKSNIRNGQKFKEYMINNDDGIFDSAPISELEKTKKPSMYIEPKNNDLKSNELKINDITDNDDNDYEEFSADYFEQIPYTKK